MPRVQKSLGGVMSIFCYCCSGKLICHLNLETYFGSGTFSRILFGGGGDDFLLCFLHGPSRTFWSYVGVSAKIL